jgi:hypothetical protein
MPLNVLCPLSRGNLFIHYPNNPFMDTIFIILPLKFSSIANLYGFYDGKEPVDYINKAVIKLLPQDGKGVGERI